MNYLLGLNITSVAGLVLTVNLRTLINSYMPFTANSGFIDYAVVEDTKMTQTQKPVLRAKVQVR
jgi:hypothetical protein